MFLDTGNISGLST